MKLSIILVNYRGWKRLRQCLESLRCLKDASFTWKVIVVDNQSADNQLPLFVADFPEFRFVENTGNLGFAHGCNTGAQQSNGEYIFFLNPDTIITLDALQQLLRTAETHPEITVLSCSQVNDNGKDTQPHGFFLRPATLTSFTRAIYRLTQRPLPIHVLKSGVQAIFPEWVSGSALLMHRKKFNELDGWCEDFWMYFEDADLCRRAWKMDGKVALLTNVQIVHNHGGASRVNAAVKALTKSEVLISKHVYIHKHFRGMRRLMMQSYLVFNNVLLGQLILALIGIMFFFIPSLNALPKLYANILSYYAGAVRNKTWISPRSVKYRK